MRLRNRNGVDVTPKPGEKWERSAPDPDAEEDGYSYAISGNGHLYHYREKSWMLADLTKIQQLTGQVTVANPTGKITGGRMFGSLTEDLRAFLKANRDVIWTVILVLLADQYVLEGALRERVKGLLEGLLSKAEGKTAVKEV